jgi:hypothetical protein
MPLTKVSAGVIAANAVQESVGSQSITGDKLGLTAVNANNIVNASITGAKLAANTVSGDVIGQNAISSNNIVSVNASVATVGTLPTARLPTGSVLQVVNTQSGAVATGTTVMVLDDTIPQITEGNEYMTLAITPTNASNKLLITVCAIFTHNQSGTWFLGALFQDSTANALTSFTNFQQTATAACILCFTHYMTAGTTSSTTFRFRAGGHQAGTTTFNGQSGGRLLGGVMASSITIMEIAA